MYLVVRADDFGYCQSINYGIIDGIKTGVITTVEFMVNMPGSYHAASLIRNYPNVSIGLHSHLQGKPIADIKKIPSLVNDKGILVLKDNIRNIDGYISNKEEIEIELEAELDEFVHLIGRLPDYMNAEGPAADVFRKIAIKHNIPIDFKTRYREGYKFLEAKGKYKQLDFQTSEFRFLGNPDKLEDQKNYDPINMLINDDFNILKQKHNVTEIIIHPGYIDDLILNSSSFTIIRLRDVEFTKSSIVLDWVKKNNLKLISVKEAIELV